MIFHQKGSSAHNIIMSACLYVVFLNIFFVFSGVHAGLVGDNCQLESTKSEKQCTLLKNCPSAKREVQEGKTPQTCGIQGKEPIVCCVEKISTESQTERISRKKCKEYAQTLSKDECIQLVQRVIINSQGSRPPHMVLLGYGEGDIKWSCAGSLISEQFVLTAAHCLVSPQYGEVRRIKLGALHNFSAKGDPQPEEFSVLERIEHPQYEPSSRFHNIALLKINRPVSFTQFARPACLYNGAPPLSSNQRFIASGWGFAHSFAEASPSNLQRVALDYFSPSECNVSYEGVNNTRKLKHGISPDSQICAGSKNDEHACQGDDGSPLHMFTELCMFDVVGVTSFGKSCTSFGIPAVYSRVQYYLDWIENIVWPSFPR